MLANARSNCTLVNNQQFHRLFFREHISYATHRLDQVFGFLQRLAQAQYMDIDGTFFDHDVIAPYFIQ